MTGEHTSSNGSFQNNNNNNNNTNNNNNNTETEKSNSINSINVEDIKLDLDRYRNVGFQKDTEIVDLNGKINEASIDPAEGKFKLKRKIYLVIRENAHLFPAFVACWVPVMCLLPYSMAMYNQQMLPVFPYVSDTATLPPQAGFFSMMMDITATLFLITAYFRYRMLKYLMVHEVPNSPIEHHKSPATMLHYDKANFAGMVLMVLTAFGTVAVGNFRVSELVSLHFVGATLCFLPMLTYFAVQTYIAYWLSKHEVESQPVTMFGFTCIGGIGLAGFCIFSSISIIIAGLYNFLDEDWRLFWGPNKKGYYWHILGTIFEWIAINSLSPLFMCMFNRFRYFEHFSKV